MAQPPSLTLAPVDLLSELPSRLSTPSPGPLLSAKPAAAASNEDATSAALRKKLLKEQRALEKAGRKAAAKLNPPAPPPPEAGPLKFLPREWGDVDGLEEVQGGTKTSILTWNVSPGFLLLARLTDRGFRGCCVWKEGKGLGTGRMVVC